MIGTIAAYIKTITALTIFSAFVGIMMPDGNFRKYVELVLGIFVLTAVLSPLLHIFNGGAEEQAFWQWETEPRMAVLSEEAYIQIEQDNWERTYGQLLEESIRSDVAERFGIKNCGVLVAFQEDGTGRVATIEITADTDQADALRGFVSDRYDILEDAIMVVD